MFPPYTDELRATGWIYHPSICIQQTQVILSAGCVFLRRLSASSYNQVYLWPHVTFIIRPRPLYGVGDEAAIQAEDYFKTVD